MFCPGCGDAGSDLEGAEPDPLSVLPDVEFLVDRDPPQEPDRSAYAAGAGCWVGPLSAVDDRHPGAEAVVCERVPDLRGRVGEVDGRWQNKSAVAKKLSSDGVMDVAGEGLMAGLLLIDLLPSNPAAEGASAPRR